MCRFTGTLRESNAAPGRCTDTRGYIFNVGINEIIAGRVTKEWTEEGSNILVYHETEAETAEEFKNKEREQMILNFITGFLFLIPVVGQALAAESDRGRRRGGPDAV